jgi:hypothetical protein
MVRILSFAKVVALRSNFDRTLFFNVRRGDFRIFVNYTHQPSNQCRFFGCFLFIMGRSLTQTQQDTVVALLGTKMEQTEIAAIANCSIRSVKRIKKNIRHWGTPTPLIFQKQGRPHEITEEAIEVRCFHLPYTVFAKDNFFRG